MILCFSDLRKYADTVFQCRIEVYVVKCESVLHSRQSRPSHFEHNLEEIFGQM
jgi:uncharacterized membrane protein